MKLIIGNLMFSDCRVAILKDWNKSQLLTFCLFYTCLGFVGLFNLLLLWPGFFLLHYTGFEDFEFPNKVVLMCIVINGLIGTVLSEFLWLWYVLFITLWFISYEFIDFWLV